MPDSHRFDPTILREYDIRGVVGDTLTAADAYAIGRGMATLVVRAGGSRVAVGYDGRVSSPDMAAALAEGLMAGGVTVLRIGRGPTPMLYYAVYHLNADGGIMVTGSHNPPNYNGFKMMLGHRAFFGRDIQDLGAMAAAGDWHAGQGAAEDVDLRADYLAELRAAYTTDAPVTAVWDCGNGATGDIAPALAASLPGRHVVLFEEVNGSFPNHHPDPTVEANLVDIRAAVTREKASVGLAFDGDGDRIGVIDEQGRILWGDQLLALLARDVLAERPGSTIIADVKASQVLFDEIAKAGGEPLMYRTGHSLIKSKMAEIGAPLAGEMSGHIFFADKYYGFDDALYVAVRFLDVLARSGRTAGELRDTLAQMINTPEVRFDCADERKFAVVDEVKARLVAAGADFNDIDGVRVSQDGGWWLLRASNTQPALVVRCEAGDADALARLKDTARAALADSGVEAPADF